MTPDSILETVLYAADLGAAETFYRDVLGLEFFAKMPERHVFFRCGRQMLLIFNAEATQKPPRTNAMPVPSHGMTGQGHVCFRAAPGEIERWRTHLLSKGVAIEADLEWPGGGRSIYFRDPAGNSVEFAEPVIWGLD
jgi:catechol 2,3-dioxygenase-like lactoylglutathione lyase family enzyme